MKVFLWYVLLLKNFINMVCWGCRICHELAVMWFMTGSFVLMFLQVAKLLWSSVMLLVNTMLYWLMQRCRLICLLHLENLFPCLHLSLGYKLCHPLLLESLFPHHPLPLGHLFHLYPLLLEKLLHLCRHPPPGKHCLLFPHGNQTNHSVHCSGRRFTCIQQSQQAS